LKKFYRREVLGSSPRKNFSPEARERKILSGDLPGFIERNSTKILMCDVLSNIRNKKIKKRIQKDI